jgi:hypothetical protein
MALTVQQIQPVAHLSLVLGVLRRLEVATVIDRLIPPHPAHMLSCGRGAVIQRQVRLYLRTHEQQLPGNKGETATPTAAVVLALFAPVAMVHIQLDTTEVYQAYGLQAYHLLVCDALGLDHAWYEAPIAHKNIKRAGSGN